MSEEIELQAGILDGAEVRVGANPQPANRLTIEIRNLGASVPRGAPPLRISVEGRLGPGEDALFLNADDARTSIRSLPSKWHDEWDFPENGSFRLKLSTYEKVWLAHDETLQIELRSLVSQTAPGKAKLWVRVLSGSGQVAPPYQKELTVTKVCYEPGIIAFYSYPRAGVRNLPGTKVTLKWRTSGLSDLDLRKNRTELVACDFSNEEGERKVKAEDALYVLSGYDGERRIRREQLLEIKLVESGWCDCRNTLLEGDPGFPDLSIQGIGKEEIQTLKEEGIVLEPLVLFSEADELYGLFRRRYAGRVDTLLFRTENPLAGWTLVEGGSLPAGACPTSPGVLLDHKLWLIGGSQIEQEVTSNAVWRFDPKAAQPTWTRCAPADDREAMPARMGHGVVVCGQRIWVLGGRNTAGKAFDDVWTWDPQTSCWELQDKKDKKEGKARWTARCLIAPAAQETKTDSVIWLYGGAQEPFSAVLFDDLWCRKGGTWDRVRAPSLGQGMKPIAAALQVFQGRLTLLGAATKEEAGVETVSRFGYQLTDPNKNAWDDIEPEIPAKLGPPGADTFSFQLVSFKSQLLLARALGTDAPDAQRNYLMAYVSATKAGRA